MKKEAEAVRGQNVSKGNDKAQEFPAATILAIRKLCKAFRYPCLAPHVYAGVEAIYPLAFPTQSSHGQAAAPSTPRKGRKAKDTADTAAPTKDAVNLLVVAILLTVTVKVQGLKEVPDEFVFNNANKALDVLRIDRDVRSEVEGWIVRVTSEGWAAGMEWWQNLPKNISTSDNGEKEDMDTDVDADEREAEIGRNRKRWHAEERGGLQAGLGTMMQEKVDWLREEKKLDYEDWKAGIIDRIHAVERGDVMVE
jgi:origin recognition complex subunit 6